MSDTETTPETPTETPAGEPKVFSEDYVKDLRNENAGLRVSKKEAVDAAKVETRAAVIGEYEPQLVAKDTEIASLKADLTTATTDSLKLRAVLGAEGVQAGDVLELVDLVQGNDEESISASVQRVLKVYGKQETKSPAFDPSQGLGGGDIPLNGDKVVRMFENALGIKTSR